MSFRWGLRTKITIALIAATSLSIGVTGAISALQSYHALRRQTEDAMLAKATALAEPVNEMIGRTRYTIDRLAREPDIVSMDPQRQRKVLELMADAIELLDGIVISGPDGRALLVDKTGEPTEALLPPRAEALLASPAASGEITLSGAFRSSSGSICIAIGAPIRRRGTVVGVLTGIIALERHSVGGMKGIRLGPSGYVYLIDAKGRTLSHPDPARLFERISDYAPPPKLEEAPGVFEWVNTEGEARVAALAPIADTGWYVVVTRLLSEAEAPARRLLTLLLAILAGGLVASVVLGAVLARWITKPVSNLMRGVRELSAGHLAYPIEAGAGDEIGQLTSAFNDMAAHLTRTIRHLESFGYSVAHDLRAPARAITVLSELVLRNEGALDEENRRRFRRILEAGRRLRLMLDGLMTLSRLSQENPALEDVDLTALARECAAERAALDPARRIDLAIAEGMKARGDPRLLRILLSVLLDNAWKFTRGRVEIGLRDRPGGAPAYFVGDDGPGFDPALAERMFRPFHRLANAQGLAGVGIGLSAAARIVELHGGTIRAESRPGEGAVFFFTLGEQE
ncbi:MAG: sensor histidine kinase [Elusimicrobiota bacterium]|nr:sensor histidine kinase [Elusimicrobiota bacterium]